MPLRRSLMIDDQALICQDLTRHFEDSRSKLRFGLDFLIHARNNSPNMEGEHLNSNL